MKQDTKQKLLEIGSEIIHLKGYHNTGIQEILHAANVPKGSFYNYFKNKEDFGLQVIDHYVEVFKTLAQDFLEDGSASPLRRLYLFLGSFIRFYGTRDYAYGCPVGNLSQEMGDLNPTFRKKLKVAVDAMAAIFQRLLEGARDGGEISSDLNIKETAFFIVSSWQGSLIRMKIEKSPEPLENHRRFIFDYILKN